MLRITFGSLLRGVNSASYFQAKRVTKEKEPEKRKKVQEQNVYQNIHIDWEVAIKRMHPSSYHLAKSILAAKGSVANNQKMVRDLEMVVQYRPQNKWNANSYDISVLLSVIRYHHPELMGNFRVKLLHRMTYTPLMKDSTNEEEEDSEESRSLELNKNFDYEEGVLVATARELVRFIKENKQQKNIKNKFKVHMIRLLKGNLHKVTRIENLCELMWIICSVYDMEQTLDILRFSDVAKGLQTKVAEIVRKDQKYRKSLLLFYPQKPHLSIKLYQNFFKLGSIFGFPSPQIAEQMMRYVIDKQFTRSDTIYASRIRILFTIYRLAFASSANKQYSKNVILAYLNQQFQTNKHFQLAIQSYPNIYLTSPLFFSLQATFYEHYLKIPSQEVDGHIVIAQLPPKPELSKFQKYLIRRTQGILILKNKYLAEPLLNIYPEAINQNAPEILEEYKSSTYGISLDNQLVVKCTQALNQMGISYEKESRIIGKKVDFLLKDKNIILELDGTVHLNYQVMDIGCSTGFRNFCLLYGGYRTIIIDIYEFNNSRSLPKLKTLIKKKLDLMQKYDARLIY